MDPLTSQPSQEYPAGTRVRVSEAIRNGDGDEGPGIDLSMFSLIGKEITLEVSPDERWPLYGKTYFWLPHWLETLDGVPLAPPPAAEGEALPEAPAEGSPSLPASPLPPDLMAKIKGYATREEDDMPDNSNMDDAYSAGYSNGARYLAQEIMAALSKLEPR